VSGIFFSVRVLTVMVSLSVACITDDDDDDDDGTLLYDDDPFCEGKMRRVVDPATGGE
jgi:hypothetical protein